MLEIDYNIFDTEMHRRFKAHIGDVMSFKVAMIVDVEMDIYPWVICFECNSGNDPDEIIGEPFAYLDAEEMLTECINAWDKPEVSLEEAEYLLREKKRKGENPEWLLKSFPIILWPKDNNMMPLERSELKNLVYHGHPGGAGTQHHPRRHGRKTVLFNGRYMDSLEAGRIKREKR